MSDQHERDAVVRYLNEQVGELAAFAKTQYSYNKKIAATAMITLVQSIACNIAAGIHRKDKTLTNTCKHCGAPV